MRRHGCGLVVVAILGLSLSGCGGEEAAPSGETRPGGAQPACDDAAVTALGEPALGRSAAFFRSSGGRVLVEVSGLPDETEQTTVQLGRGRVAPMVNQAEGTVVGAVARLTVIEGQASAVALAPERYWLVSSGGGEVSLQTCPDVIIDEVRPAKVPTDAPSKSPTGS